MSLEEDYKAIVEAVKTTEMGASNDEKLIAYGLFKQVEVGDINTERPGMLDFTGKAKWDAWQSRKGMGKEEAMKKYCTEVGAQFVKYEKPCPVDMTKYPKDPA
mmetsp:Transcript_83521/g.145182  ORF Transcript_83521/g.145182 Transcript_83521/m.145182 type:complete len:103 (+) Transcript_83521:84-392(+)